MQRFIRNAALALAGIALSAAALAQSSVTIAGRIDLGPQYIDNGVTKLKGIDSGAYTASRMMFKGNEDLGDGLSAGFYLEMRYNADTGATQSAAKFFNAGSQVYLASKDWGSITLGRQYVPIFWPFLFGDDTGPLRLHNYSALQSVQRSNFVRVAAAASPIKTAGTLDSIAGGIYSLSITSAFEDNLAIYKTPNFGGATVMLAVGAPEGYPAGGGKVYGGNIEYRNGGLYAALGATQKIGRVPLGSANEAKVNEEVASAMYALTQSFKLWGNVHPWKYDSNGTPLKGDDWMLGASYWFPSSMLWVNYANKKISDCTACNSRGFGLGYHYFLSKRTELYASVARVGNDANSANTLNGFAPGAIGQNIRGVAAGLALTY